MTLIEPYFMNNSEWYRFDEEQRKYVLTEYAPEKAKESYKEFYKALESVETDILVLS